MVAIEDEPPLVHQVRECLRRSSFGTIRKLKCDASGRVVIVHGRVPSFYTKQIALALVNGVPGVEEIVDQIEVRT